MPSRWMNKAIFGLLAGAVLLAGCGDPAPPFHPVASVQEIMRGILDPAADVLWASVGTILTEESIEEIYPRNDEEWALVEYAGLTIMETGNLLMIGERAKDHEKWMESCQALVEVGKTVVDAALTQDPEEIFQIGGTVYDVCTSCHQTYWVDGSSAQF